MWLNLVYLGLQFQNKKILDFWLGLRAFLLIIQWKNQRKRGNKIVVELSNLLSKLG